MDSLLLRSSQSNPNRLIFKKTERSHSLFSFAPLFFSLSFNLPRKQKVRWCPGNKSQDQPFRTKCRQDPQNWSRLRMGRSRRMERGKLLAQQRMVTMIIRIWLYLKNRYLKEITNHPSIHPPIHLSTTIRTGTHQLEVQVVQEGW